MTRGSAAFGGVGAIAFGVFTFVGFFLMNPAGGKYSQPDVIAYVQPNHVFAAGVGMLLGLIGVVGLVALLATLRQLAAAATNELRSRVFWGVGLAAAAAFGAGWGIAIAQPIGHAEAGTTISVPPMTTYIISVLGVELIYGAGAILLGLALIVFAVGIGGALPAWLRWLTLAVGVVAIASLAFFPFFVLLLWAVLLGIWLLARGSSAAAAADVGSD